MGKQNDQLKESRLLWAFALCSFLVGLDALVVGPLIPEIAKSLRFQVEAGGLLITAYALAYGLSAPLFGPISDRWGRKKMMLAGIIVFSTATALTSLTNDFSLALFCRGAAGIGAAMLMPSIYAAVGDLFHYERRGKVMGMLMGAMIGSQIAGVPAGAFLAKYFSWNLSFLFIALFGLLAIMVLAWTVPAAAPKQDIGLSPLKAYAAQFHTAFTKPAVLFALCSTFLWMAGLQGMFAYVGVYYDRHFHAEVDTIGLIAMIAAVCSASGSMFGGRLSDRIGKQKVIRLCACFSAAGVLSFSIFTGNLLAAVLIQSCWAFFVGAGQSVLTALISELSPAARGTVLSLNSSFMYLGMMAATAVSALLLESGFDFWMIGILCSLEALAVVPAITYALKGHSEEIGILQPGAASDQLK
jgi:predicted MFS family arabinose efflux permease